MKDLAIKYDHRRVESNKYDKWVKNGYFTAGDLNKKPYCIVIPPPNVTGKLHLGHAWDTTLQDIIARYKRMQGYDMLWLAGMDHAGIATQAKVDARLKNQGISRYDIGRENFLAHAWAWKEEYAKTIREQWAKMGLSLDYTRERFTLDDGLSKAVKKVFVDLYNDGLIYQGERIINWDPQAKTALSNIEVIHKEIEGKFYTFSYKFVDSDRCLYVATTRPETMFGDVCVVVNPKDERFKNIVGKNVINPANHQVIPVIADEYIDMEFGTGAMKCTPAHDPNDFIIGEKYGLARPICINEDGTMNELAGEFMGMDRFECRDALVNRIESENNLIKVEKHVHQVGHSERTDVIVEPYLSKQWFVKMKPLAKAVIDHQQLPDEKINFFPPRFEKNFAQWLDNIEDWCISRQLWWGHRIPAYYHKDTKKIYVGIDEPTDIDNWIQDEDVLDTWFSSALWPFSTLGWPDESDDLDRYYPNDTLVTGYDIIFFWVARMAFQARYFTNKRPFKDCLIHGLIRDEQGRKMSKSLGNGIDPMDVIDRYGVDSLRFFLTTNSTPGQDIRYSPEKIEAAWNFINKIWNASRFTLMNLDGPFNDKLSDLSDVGVIDRWIINKFNKTLLSINNNMDKYEFALVGNELYSFIWDDFCSWYIELAKAGLYSDDQSIKLKTQTTLVIILKNILKLLHPFMPFVSEEIYHYLPHDEESLCISQWPIPIDIKTEQASIQCERLINIIKGIREVKIDAQLKPSTELLVAVKNENDEFIAVDEAMAMILKKMTHAIWTDKLDGEVMIKPITNGVLYIPQSQVIDKQAELTKLLFEKEKLEKEVKRAQGMLDNPNFISKAPADKVETEKIKLAEYQRQYDLICERLKGLNNE
ncbi:MAG: valine--tRNA ligase [Erysipelotrichaceae bacterium]|nr:valine--tRNA ligase [Erysipelotrichaceae bacterium]MDD4642730.1 valine--tRNA ligase [Erysipelotrichaceae bacterium]